MDDSSTPGKHLDPSELGTKEYWDALYQRELQNHADDDEDEGTIWFDESNAEETVLQELDKLAAEGLLSKSSSTFLDLGTGNGHMLFALREVAHDDDDDQDGGAAGPWRGDMVGVDYSTPSIDLARRIAAQRHDRDDISASTPSQGELRLETWDLLIDTPGPWLPTTGTFDVVLDKGTFDAISLMPFADSSWHPCAIYRYKVLPLIKAGGFLVVTSCNWTRDELAEWILPHALAPTGNGREEGSLELFREATYSSFSFGGKSGQSIVTLIFRRR